jgi:hypothetical protein
LYGNEESEIMKSYLVALSLAAFPATIFAQQADPCAGLVGSALGQCRGDQQKLQQQHLEQQLEQQQRQLQQQQQQQSQLAEQQRQMQQQLENMRLQNELLQKQVQQDKLSSQPVRASATNYSEVKNWKSENPWYGRDYVKTSFAMRYAKQLQREQPDLVGRPFLDAVSAKVSDTFGASK